MRKHDKLAYITPMVFLYHKQPSSKPSTMDCNSNLGAPVTMFEHLSQTACKYCSKPSTHTLACSCTAKQAAFGMVLLHWSAHDLPDIVFAETRKD